MMSRTRPLVEAVHRTQDHIFHETEVNHHRASHDARAIELAYQRSARMTQAS